MALLVFSTKHQHSWDINRNSSLIKNLNNWRSHTFIIRWCDSLRWSIFYTRGQQIFIVKSQAVNISGCSGQALSQLFNSVVESSHRLRRRSIKEQAWLCSSKVMFTKAGGSLNLTPGLELLTLLFINKSCISSLLLSITLPPLKIWNLKEDWILGHVHQFCQVFPIADGLNKPIFIWISDDHY